MTGGQFSSEFVNLSLNVAFMMCIHGLLYPSYPSSHPGPHFFHYKEVSFTRQIPVLGWLY